MDVTIIRVGPGNESYPHGTVVSVICTSGYSLNIGSNRTVRCARGFWKPKEPECLISPCIIPDLSNGEYNLNSTKIPTGSTISHGETVSIQCNPGFQLLGSSVINCWHGNWSTNSFPECVPSPCSLPEIIGGHYLGGYRSGLTISHGSFVQYECSTPFFRQTEVSPRCVEGALRPEPPGCIGQDGFKLNQQVLPTSSSSLVDNKIGDKTRSDNGGGGIEGGGRESVKDKTVNTKETMNQIDETEDRLMEAIIKEDEKEEKYLNRVQDAFAFKWCPPPEKIEQLLKYPDNDYLDAEVTTPNIESTTSQFNETDDSSWTEGYVNLTEVSESFIEQDTLSNFTEENDNSTNFKYHHNRGLPPGTEIVFRCVPLAGPGANVRRNFRKTTWRITCDSGSWFGQPTPCEDEEELNLESLANKTCIFEYGITVGDNVLAFIEDEKPVHEAEFQPGTVLDMRCVDIGKYSLYGSSQRKCIYGDWDGVKPTCYGLSQQHDYALEKPPTILFRHQAGPIAQSNDGKLIVYPGTILHLECLWIRKFGTPSWEVNHGHRAYPQGWTTEPGRDSTLEYRLSIYHADETDSGLYTCVTPVKHRHSVEIVVKAIYCPELSIPEGVFASNIGIRMNSKVIFNCAQGMRLQGNNSTTCLASGRWSNPVPKCLIDITLRTAGSSETLASPSSECLQPYDSGNKKSLSKKISG